MSIALSALELRLQTMIGDEDAIYVDKYANAINNASRELYPDIFRRLVDETLITGSALPNAHSNDWLLTTYPDHWRVTGVTALEETTVIRGGTKSAKVTRATTDGSLYCSDAEWQGLLDLMGTQVSFKCWVWASTGSQAYIEITTKQADGTAQTETSSAHSGLSEWELLEIEDYTLNGDLTDIQFSRKVITTDGFAYFGSARVTGKGLYQYLLPLDFQNGELQQVWLQTSGYSDDICDDLELGGNQYAEEFGWSIITDGDYKYLRFPYTPTSNRKIKLIGYCPLEADLSSSTDTITLRDEQVNLLLHYAAHLLYEMQKGIVSSDMVEPYERGSAYHLAKAEMLRRKTKMSRPPASIRWRY